jgi:hypothetical protein
MKNEQREKMVRALRSLPRKINTFVEFEAMASEILPYVPLSDLARLYRILKGRKNWTTVALPPVFVKGGILAAGFCGDQFEIYGSAIDEAEIFYGKEAEEYGEAGWGSDLIRQNYVEIAKIYLQDPATLAVERVAFAGFSRQIEEMRGDDSKPLSELCNEAIIQITGDDLFLKEMAATAGHFISTMFHCVNCGCPLADNISCDGCGAKFRYDPGDILWEKETLGCALPAKLEEFFEFGHREGFFSTAPFVYRRKEREIWLKASQEDRKAEE